MSTQDLEKAEPAQATEPTVTERPPSKQSFMSKVRLREPGPTAPFTRPVSHIKSADDTVVDFDVPDDPYRPINWSFRKKVLTTILYGMTTMGATWASSIYSPSIPSIEKEFHLGSRDSLTARWVGPGMKIH